MNAVTARILIDAYAINAEIEGMKAENEDRARRGLSVAYTEEAFEKHAAQLRNLSNALYDAWQQGQAE